MCLFLMYAKIDEKDFKFVISAIDYNAKTTLYPQAIDSIIKYFGSIGSRSDSGGEAAGVMDLETLWSGNRGGGFRGGFRGGGNREEKWRRRKANPS